jgi:hypothetical protein
MKGSNGFPEGRTESVILCSAGSNDVRHILARLQEENHSADVG